MTVNLKSLRSLKRLKRRKTRIIPEIEVAAPRPERLALAAMMFGGLGSNPQVRRTANRNQCTSCFQVIPPGRASRKCAFCRDTGNEVIQLPVT